MSRLPYPVRRAGAALVGRVPVPILSGPNRGRLWSLASSGRGYVTGRFEGERVRSMLALVREGDRAWDVGAHKGYVSLALSRSVGRRGSVVAVEPSYRNLEYLRRHVAWNGPGNVEILPVALSDEAGEEAFGGTASTVTYRLGRGDERVRVRTIRGLVEEDGRPVPEVLKVDVEGTEAAVLRGAGDRLGEIQLLFVAVHDRESYRACRSLLRGAGLRVGVGTELREAAEGEGLWPGDPDLVAWGPGRDLTREEVTALPAFGE